MLKRHKQPSSQPSKKKTPAITGVSHTFCGVGGNRTLVQTSNGKAFYTFSFHFIFELRLTENRPPLTLLPLLKSLIGTPKLRCWHLWCLQIDCRQQGLSRDIRLPDLVGTWQRLTMIQSIMQLERSYFRHLMVET